MIPDPYWFDISNFLAGLAGGVIGGIILYFIIKCK